MPIYEYRCEKGHNFEVRQGFSDDPVQTCQECGASVQRVFRPVAVHFKGSGFYNTDYGTRKRAREQKESTSSEKSSEKTSDAGSSSSGEGKSSGDKKPAGGEAAKPAAA
jgi:putative FmdB family regulatory protein